MGAYANLVTSTWARSESLNWSDVRSIRASVEAVHGMRSRNTSHAILATSTSLGSGRVLLAGSVVSHRRASSSCSRTRSYLTVPRPVVHPKRECRRFPPLFRPIAANISEPNIGIGAKGAHL